MRRSVLLFSFFCLALTLFIGVERFLHSRPKTLLEKITGFFPVKLDAIALPQCEEKMLEEILDQPYTYLCRGTQSYVFLSEDEQWILKFFKQKGDGAEIVKSCLTAYTELKEETALVYLQVDPDHVIHKKIALIDKHGKKRTADLSQMMFLVQKKAELIYPRISRLMREGRVDAAEKTIGAIFDFLENLAQKGVCHHDPILKRNFGLIGEKVVQIDVGALAIDPSQASFSRGQIPFVTQSFRRWIESRFPELLQSFDQQLLAKQKE